MGRERAGPREREDAEAATGLDGDGARALEELVDDLRHVADRLEGRVVRLLRGAPRCGDDEAGQHASAWQEEEEEGCGRWRGDGRRLRARQRRRGTLRLGRGCRGTPCRGSSDSACDGTGRASTQSSARALPPTEALEGGNKASDGDALDLDVPDRLLHLLCDVCDLDARVRLDDAHEVLLEERVVQRGEVRPDDGVVRQLCAGRGCE